MPVGASKWVGASLSSRARNSHGNSVISASDRSPDETSFNDNLSNKAGTSQSSRRAASASSDRSGQEDSSPSALRKNITRSRHCFDGFDQGNRSSPTAIRPSAS